MPKSVALVAFSFLLLSSSVNAEPVPDYVLDRDYLSCMGGESAQSDPQRDQYCQCTRDAMRSWDLDTYGAVATEQSKAASKEQVPTKIGDIAKACIEKILK
ncbi:MAG: hypothetical protein WAO98_05155 [Alphaproteobacteria bacterium]